MNAQTVSFHLTYLMCAGSAMLVAICMVRFAYKKTIVTNIGNTIILGGVISSLVTHIFYATCWQSIFGIIPSGMVIFLLILQYVKRKIQVPLQSIVAISNALSEGKLIVSQLDNESYAAENELGDLSQGLNITYRNLSQIVLEIIQNINILTDTVKVLVENSRQLQEDSEQMKTRSANVAAASEEMTVGMATVSESAEQSARNLGIISTAIEQMSTTVSEISQNTELASGISKAAVEQAGRTTENIRKLESSANEANTIIDTINEIVDQTKLLSLNATIEAARAGEAGKGFAVVAGEVKQLADQTENAVGDIRRKLAAIGKFQVETVADIGKITDVIQKVDEVVSTIAASIEEQNITTRDIARNVESTNRGVADVSRQVADSAGISQQVAREISVLNQVVAEVGTAGGSVGNSAEKLSRMTRDMEALVEKFQVVEDFSRAA